jgi:uncharacterized protein YjiS (DUF1127 family)
MNRFSRSAELFFFKLPEVQSYHSRWDDADYWPVVPNRSKSWLARAVADVRVRWDQMKERRRVIRELEAMSDRELTDLGISRYDIPRVFDPKFTAERAF